MKQLDEKLGLWELTPNVYIIHAGVNVLIVRTETGAVLIDSGQDKEYGRTIRKALDLLELEPQAIITTHSHADHYGGHDYLQRQYPSATTYAPAFEAAVIQAPLLEPVYLFHGAYPPKPLRSKWLMAKPARIDQILTPGVLYIGGTEFTCIDVAGHAHEQIAVVVNEVLFAADAVFGPEALAKYPLPFVQNVAKQQTAFTTLREVAPTCAYIVPGHGFPSQHIEQVISDNEAALKHAQQAILEVVAGQNTSDLVAAVTAALQLDMSDLARYQLNVCALHAHLSYFLATGAVRYELADGWLTWHRNTTVG